MDVERKLGTVGNQKFNGKQICISERSFWLLGGDSIDDRQG